MRNASAKSIIKSNNLQFNLHVQNDDVLYNSENPVNPDSKPGVADKFILKPVREKTRGIASLQR